MPRDQREQSAQQSKRPARKQSEYGKHLMKNKKLKKCMALREKQFKRFFSIAIKT